MKYTITSCVAFFVAAAWIVFEGFGADPVKKNESDKSDTLSDRHVVSDSKTYLPDHQNPKLDRGLFLDPNPDVALEAFLELETSEQFEALRLIVEEDPKKALAIAQTFSGDQKRVWILKVVENTLEIQGLSEVISLLDLVSNGTTKTAIAHRIGEFASQDSSSLLGGALRKLFPADRFRLLEAISVSDMGGFGEIKNSAWFNELEPAEKMPLLLQAAFIEGQNSREGRLSTSLTGDPEQMGADNIKKIKEGFFSGVLASSPEKALDLLLRPEWDSFYNDKVHLVVAAMANKDPTTALESVVKIESDAHRLQGVRALILDLIMTDTTIAADFAENRLKGPEQKVAVSTIISQLRMRGLENEAKEWEDILN